MNVALRNLVNAGPLVNRPSSSVVDSIPKFEGGLMRMSRDSLIISTEWQFQKVGRMLIDYKLE